ncbi:MAG: PAS domain-containing sensor histidine kinase [Clostridia bacterium]|nr:PAS domain-containing sensor histidine kinase [Clostridia bacterium]
MTKRIFAAICLCAGGALSITLLVTTILLAFLGGQTEIPAVYYYVIAAVFVLTLLLIVALALHLSKEIVKPLHELNPELPVVEPTYRELEPLLTHIGNQQRRLKEQSIELQRKKNEFETATNHMSEGLVLLNEEGIILSINRVAVKLLDIQRYCIGKSLRSFCESPELSALLSRVQGGVHAEATVCLGSQNYQIHAGPTISENRVTGITLLIFDITEKEKAEQMRQEFTANVSHELKTPLHTISGYAELLAGGMVRTEDVPQFSDCIYTEAKRMITLVEDIIKLSHLEEGASDMKKENVDLYALANTTVQSLNTVAAESGITLCLIGENAPIFGIRQLLSSIVYNLCDNAIKYNRKNGSVTLTVQNKQDHVLLTVADTGIGIPAAEQERIFERFYRVDKSHSKALGGTGLGLSIVKHAAKIHNATIDLQSTPDRGTEIKIHFPKS